MKKLKTLMGFEERKHDQAEIEKENQLKDEKLMQERSKMLAFQRTVKEVEKTYTMLNDKYNKPCIDLNRSEILKHKDDITMLTSEFDKMRERVDRLINYTDLYFGKKEETLDYVSGLLSKLESSKHQYERDVYHVLVANDLTEEKIKLAAATKIEIGKFNGSLGSGDDCYTFKSKFMKAMGITPKV